MRISTILIIEAYSVAGKTYLHQQVEDRKNMSSNLVFLAYRD